MVLDEESKMNNCVKTISVIVPTYNEEENIPIIYKKITDVFSRSLNNYKYEILYIDNCSTDSSRFEIEKLCNIDENVTGIFNARNFGFNRSTYYGLLQGVGDCSILVFADMQDPPEMIVDFVQEWEKGYKIVIGIKDQSNENKGMYFIRSLFYRMMNKITDTEQIEQFDGFGLYDRKFIEILENLNDPEPYLRGIVAELGYDRKEIYYKQEKRKLGKTKFNFYKLYDTAMLGITSYSKVVLRLATIIGFSMSCICFITGIVTVVMKLCNWNRFQVGIAGISVGIYFLGSLLLFFVGLQGEYILNINARVMRRPLVVEQKRINRKSRDKI